MTLFKILSLILIFSFAVSCSSVSSKVADLKTINLKKKLQQKKKAAF